MTDTLKALAPRALRQVARYARNHGAGLNAALRIIKRGRRLRDAIQTGRGFESALWSTLSDVYGAGGRTANAIGADVSRELHRISETRS